jgi:endonuclease III
MIAMAETYRVGREARLRRSRIAGYSAPMATKLGKRERAKAVFEALAPLWPDARPLLSYRDPFELVCAVALSAQTTDDQVNRATPGLFAHWPTPAAMASADIGEVEAAIRSIGFFRTKARHLVAAAAIIEERFGGQVPSTIEELLELPGVGRKTANLVASACFGRPGIIVDTHVLRVCLRLGLGKKADADDMEKRIAETVPREEWPRFSHAVNRHGKFSCRARKPACVPYSGLPACPLLEICPRIGLSLDSSKKKRN